MIEEKTLRKFYGVAPAVGLFISEPRDSKAVLPTLSGDRPMVIAPFYSLVPGWKFFSRLHHISMNTYNSCNLNDNMADVLMKTVGLKELDPDNGKNLNLSLAMESERSNSFYIGGDLHMELACAMMSDSGNQAVLQSEIDSFNKLMDGFCIRDIIDFRSSESWHYYEYILSALATKKYMRKNEIYDLQVALFDNESVTSLLSAVNSWNEINAECLGFKLGSAKILNVIMPDGIDKGNVNFTIELDFYKEHMGLTYSTNNFL